MHQFQILSRTHSYRRKLLKLKLYNFLITALIFCGIMGVVSVVVLFLWYSKDLPSPDKIQRKEGYSTIIYDRNNKPLYDIYEDKNRIPVSFTDMPEYLKKATIAVEDKDFYKHQGFDPKGMVRAIINTISFRGLQGGSTLTQQLVKNVLLTNERSLPRKIKEFILAVQIERKYSKDEILQMYLNEAPYGGTMWGIESAAQGYFGKSTKDLGLLESVVLAGLPQSPSYYSPTTENKAYIKRAEEVLRRMKEESFITQTQEVELKKELGSMQFSSGSAQFKASHFVLYVKDQLVDKFGEKAVEKGLRVITTMDGELQEKAETIMKEEIDKLKTLNVSNGALIAINPQTGEILSYIGSKDYNSQEDNFQGKFDVVSLGYRQPGSALKPISYAVAFNKGYTPASVLMDVETTFPGGENLPDYKPKNYDNKFRGPVQIRYALANSINIPAVKITALVGIKDILKTAYDMGIGSLEPTDENVKKFGLSITLGGGEVRLMDLTQAYGVFATGGIKNELYSITKVTDTDGKVLYEAKKTAGKRVINQDVTYLISNILSDNDARKEVFGSNSYLYIPGKTVAVKTGTTDDKKDNWAVGYTPQIAIGVWVGNNDNKPMNPKLASGVTGAAPIWNRVMKLALKDKKDEPFAKPDNITQVTIDSYVGGQPHGSDPTRSEYFIKGTEPTAVSPIYKKIKLSKSDNNKLANAVEIAAGNYDEKEFIVFTEDDPTMRDGANKWQDAINEWLKTQGDAKYHPPGETSSNSEDSVVVKIKQPEDHKRIDSNDFDIIVDAYAKKSIKKIEYYVNNDRKETVENRSFEKRVHLDNGVYRLKFKAYDEDNRTGESEIIIGINMAAEFPTQTPVPPTPTVILTPTP